MDLSSTDLIMILASYLAGSIPFGLIVAKFAGIEDLRKQGSGNIGATNALRVGGKKLGAITLLCDLLKGVIPVVIAKFYFSSSIMALSAAFVVIGHVFPIWLKFKGGKGVATTFGALLGIYFFLGFLSFIVWAGVFFFTRISSLSAILTMIATPTFAFFFLDILGYEVLCLVLFLSILVVAKHSSNIKMLIKGEEKRVL